MFGKVASDVLGLSDIGRVVPPQDYDKVDTDAYVLHEAHERIYFLIKSRTDEYCFTNLALIFLDGSSTISKKRILRRLNYHRQVLQEVQLETTGGAELDLELKLQLGDQRLSIEVSNKDTEAVKALYKSLVSIAELQHENEIQHRLALQSIETTVRSLATVTTQTPFDETFRLVNQYNFSWLQQIRQQYVPKDFGEQFEKFRPLAPEAFGQNEQNLLS